MPTRVFIRRLLACVGLAFAIIAVALGIGIAGYHFIAGLPWIDAVLNASMILAGMGPVDELPSDAAKVFASAYALFSGVVLISLMALLLTPVAHRVLHKFHLSDEDVNEGQDDKEDNDHAAKKTRPPAK